MRSKASARAGTSSALAFQSRVSNECLRRFSKTTNPPGGRESAARVARARERRGALVEPVLDERAGLRLGGPQPLVHVLERLLGLPAPVADEEHAPAPGAAELERLVEAREPRVVGR